VALRGLSGPARAILLDALGTLVELEPPAPRLRSQLKQRFGLTLTRAQAEQAIGAEIAYYRAHLEQGRDGAGLAVLRRGCADVLSRELVASLGREVPNGPAMVDALLASLHFRPYPEVGPVLSELHGRGLRLVVVSNWDASLPGVLDRLGLSGWLHGVVTSAEVGAGKPNPIIFERGLTLAGVAAEEALHVGDSPLEDVQGARTAGIQPVLISRAEPSRRPRDPGLITIGSLRELAALVSAADG
jgi:putative hydrolase of the HAD superfamily